MGQKIKKDAGDAMVGGTLAVMMSFVFIIIVTLAFVSWEVQFFQRDDVELAVRASMLSVEKEGCLTEDQKNQLTTRLQDIGMTNINFTGSTMDVADYGDEVVIHLTGKLKVHTPFFRNSNDLFSFESKIEEQDIDITRKGIAVTKGV